MDAMTFEERQRARAERREARARYDRETALGAVALVAFGVVTWAILWAGAYMCAYVL